MNSRYPVQHLKSLILLLFLTVVFFVHVAAQSTTAPSVNDTLRSLPLCIEALQAKDSLAIAIEYRYKGQRWFVISVKRLEVPSRISDTMTTTRFLDDSCRVVCTWKKGGVAGLNRVIPDTVDKNKLFPFVPDTIRKKAIAEKITVIQVCSYNRNIVYLLSKQTLAQNRSTYHFDDRYYDARGTLVKTNSYTQTWSLPRKEVALIPELDRVRL